MMLGDVIRTLILRLIFLLLMMVFAVPIVILLLLPERWRYDSWYARWLRYFFYKAILYGSCLPISVVGKEHITDQPTIFVANHQSSLDIPLVGSLLGTFPHVWLATNWLLRSIIYRWTLPRVTVVIDMSNPTEGMRSLVRAIHMINNQHRHVVIFAEGGRYADGEIHDFYGGFVILAKKTGRPVIPVLIQGAHKVYPKGAFLIHYYPIHVIVGEPLVMRVDETTQEFKDRVYQWFVMKNKELHAS